MPDNEICRKKNAFRETIRRKHIDSIFRESRKYHADLETSSQFHENNDMFQNGKDRDNERKFPFVSSSIPRIPEDGEGDREYIERIKSFSNYEEFSDYLNAMFNLLPQSVILLNDLLSENPPLIQEFNKFLQTSDKIRDLAQKFHECSLPEFQTYIHLLERVIISCESFETQKFKECLVQENFLNILSKTVTFTNSNKFQKVETLKNLFNFLFVIGDEIAIIDPVQVLTITGLIRDIFGKFFEEYQKNESYFELFSTVISLCNNVAHLGREKAQKGENTEDELNRYYHIHQLKNNFIRELLKRPTTFIKNICELGQATTTLHELVYIISFFVNLLFTIEEPQLVHPFNQNLIVFINILLMKHSKILENSTNLSRLLLRLINNIAVNDILTGQELWSNYVIQRITGEYGGWILKMRGFNEVESREPEIFIFEEFISTICNYINFVYHYNPVNSCGFEIVYKENIGHLLDDYKIHIILAESLEISAIRNGDIDTLTRVLETLIDLSNYEENLNRTKNEVNIEILKHKEVLQQIYESIEDKHTVEICEYLISIAEEEETKITKREGEFEMFERNRKEMEEQMGNSSEFDEDFH